MEFSVDILKSVIYLLQQQYESEFEVEDGLNQHPIRLSFGEWLLTKKLITKQDEKSTIIKKD